MRAKRLGRAGVEIPVFGIGTAFIGGRACSAGESQLGEDPGVQTVIGVVEVGFRLIDTAPLYCGIRSEKMIGRAFRAEYLLRQERRGYEVIPINTCAYLAMAYGK